MRRAVYVLLGMHRGGTSALAKGLHVLGISLGDNLMPASHGTNDTGFWEDLDIVALNEEVLAAFGDTWHSVRLIDEHQIEPARFDALLRKGCGLLEQKVSAFSPFGFKDPRTCRLLFYWRRVFRALDLEPYYVIAMRNPLSVALSLAQRDQFPAAKCHTLWLQHMLGAMRGTEAQKRVVVDYDRLLGQPVHELTRMGEALELPVPENGSLDVYAVEFLSSNLRHSVFDRNAVARESQVPPVAVRLFQIMDRMASDE